MSNFIEEFKKGQAGLNQGLSLGPGLNKIEKELNGVQKGMQYIIAAESKVGKSKFTNYGFVVHAYIDALAKGIPIEFIYFSFEMSRILQEYEFATYFLFLDYGITHIKLDDETFKGKSIIPLDSKYLRGKLTNDNGQTILVKPIIKEKLIEVYQKWIIPLFGEYSANGIKLSNGVIDFIEHKENVTGLYNFLLKKAEKDGVFEKVSYTYKNNETLATETREKIVSYTPFNPEKYTIIITDTIRKIPKERNFTMKENIDKWLEYCSHLRNLVNYTFVNIIHLNRALSGIDNIKFKKDHLFPDASMVKDSGNASEECDYLITLFDPNDDKFNLTSHFGVKIKDGKGNPLYPGLRTIHIVESRHGECPLHFSVQLEGNLNNFKQIAL